MSRASPVITSYSIHYTKLYELLTRFDAAEVHAALRGASVFMGVPTYYTRLLALPDFPASGIALRLWISGSAPLLVETFDAFEQRTGQRILERYGMSEAGMIIV